MSVIPDTGSQCRRRAKNSTSTSPSQNGGVLPSSKVTPVSTRSSTERVRNAATSPAP